MSLIQSPNIQTQPMTGYIEGDGPETVVMVGSAVSETSPPFMPAFLHHRQELMEALGWEQGDQDRDRVDEDPSTLQIVEFEVAGSSDLLGNDNVGLSQFVTGMRLQPIDSFQGSLTHDMMRQNPALQERVSQQIEGNDLAQEALENGRLYDLTRLTPRLDLLSHPRAMVRSYMHLIGASIVATEADTEQSAWLYATKGEVQHGLLEGNGIVTEVIATDRFSADDTEEYFVGIADPLASLEKCRDAEVRRHQAAYRHAARSMAAFRHDS